MGSSNWSQSTFDTLKSQKSTQTQSQIFSNTIMPADMNPSGVKFRESRDSAANPESVAILVALDVTGSMGEIPEAMVKGTLGTMIDTLMKHGVAHPAIMFAGIGDANSDKCPFQIGQFESGTKELDKWLTETYLEGGGGGQGMESYLFAHLFAARHTSIDCFEKRGLKGFLFTIGDEGLYNLIEGGQLKEVMGYKEAQDLTAEQLIAEAKRMYHVFHIHINSTGYKDDKTVLNSWNSRIKEGLIILDDYRAVAETIATTVAVVNGANLKDVVRDFNSSTAKSVSTALAHVTTAINRKSDTGVVAL